MAKREQTVNMRKVIQENVKCELCGSRRNLEAHHIIPIVYGGDDSLENLLCVCASCHVKLTPRSLLTKKGIEIARANGKHIGGHEGRKMNVKKASPAKECSKKNSRDFEGSLSDPEVIKLAGISRNTYYRYKAELRDERGY